MIDHKSEKMLFRIECNFDTFDKQGNYCTFLSSPTRIIIVHGTIVLTLGIMYKLRLRLLKQHQATVEKKSTYNIEEKNIQARLEPDVMEYVLFFSSK